MCVTVSLRETHGRSSVAVAWATSGAVHARLINQHSLHLLHVAGWAAACSREPVSDGGRGLSLQAAGWATVTSVLWGGDGM